MSHPDPAGAAATTPWRIGDELFNPVTLEHARILEAPWQNPAGRARAEMTALVGARVLGEHRHPGITERFTVLDGELTVSRDGKRGILRAGESAELAAGSWHDWWNAADRDARVLIEVTPGARFSHMLETMFGLATLGHTDAKGMPNLLQMALTGREFSDTVQFRSPPPAVQKVVFAALAPLAHAMGYRGVYPQLSRTLLGAHPDDLALVAAGTLPGPAGTLPGPAGTLPGPEAPAT
jgi:quercetin dioxygenase-like cupin family protein